MAKFFRRGVSKLKYAPAVAGNSPTRAEINAGVDLSPQVSAINGFQLTNSPIAVPNLQDTFTPQINGEDTVADSSIVFNDDDTATTVRTTLAKGTAGNLLLFPYGDVVGKRVEKWPFVSTGVNDEWTTDNTPAKFTVGVAITAVPFQNGTTPA